MFSMIRIMHVLCTLSDCVAFSMIRIMHVLCTLSNCVAFSMIRIMHVLCTLSDCVAFSMIRIMHVLCTLSDCVAFSMIRIMHVLCTLSDCVAFSMIRIMHVLCTLSNCVAFSMIRIMHVLCTLSDCVAFSMIRIMHVLCTLSDCVAKDDFPPTMARRTMKEVLIFLNLFIEPLTLQVSARVLRPVCRQPSGLYLMLLLRPRFRLLVGPRLHRQGHPVAVQHRWDWSPAAYMRTTGCIYASTELSRICSFATAPPAYIVATDTNSLSQRDPVQVKSKLSTTFSISINRPLLMSSLFRHISKA